jgi:NitT/TauT family transport system ATP-binding protein
VSRPDADTVVDDRRLTGRPSAIRLQAVGKTFRGRRRRTPALEGVSLAIEAGEFLSLLGPSGCGKSTLLGILAGFIPADTGEVLVDGRRVRGPGSDRGVLFQTPTLFPWLTTRQNVLYGPKARGALTPEVREEADALLDTVGLSDFRDAYPHELSGGMRHRAAFARVLINHPGVLLMDEPFGALDAITRAGMQRFLLELWQRHRMTIVFVTHDVEEATLLSDRVAVLSGRPGRTKEVVDIPLPRPRAYEDTETLEFVTAKRRIREVLER